LNKRIVDAEFFSQSISIPSHSYTSLSVSLPTICDIIKMQLRQLHSDIDSSLQLFQHVVRWPKVRELVEEVIVWPNLICHVSVRVYREEEIDNVIG